MARLNVAGQLELIAGARAGGKKSPRPRAELLGRTFFDGSSDVRVVGLCPSNPSQVILERRLDGKKWTAPSSLMRLIFSRGRKLRPQQTVNAFVTLA